MTDCKKILVQAKALYDKAHLNYRDSVIAVGRLLHQFVIERLKEWDGKTQQERRASGITRNAFIKEAAEFLVIDEKDVQDFIRTSMTVDLLYDGKTIGNLGLGSISKFSVFIRRKDFENSDPDLQYPSDVETWVIEPAYVSSATDLFRRCVKDSIGYRTVSKLVDDILDAGPMIYKTGHHRKKKTKRHTHRERTDLPSMAFMSEIAKNASPGDLADICIDLIQRSSDPVLSSTRLIELLREFIGRKLERRRAIA